MKLGPMKVLMLTPYVSLPNRPEFSRNMTGFGYMVYDIANSVGREAHVDLLASDSIGDAFVDNNVHFIRRRYKDIVLNVFNCVSPRILISLLRKYKMNKGTALRVIYYWLISGYYSRIIRHGGYDVVHIHGCNFSNEIWMTICKKHNVKYLITLHALNSFSDTVKLEPAGKQYERDFLERVNKGMVQISVISSGMKRTIERLNGSIERKNIKVVCNSFKEHPLDLQAEQHNIRKFYNIPEDAFVLLYAGNISENKNQRQLVDSFDLIKEPLRKSLYVLFCGKYDNNYPFEDMIRNSQFSDHFFLCGQVDRDRMPAYFEISDGVVLLSVAEGFGLSLIEGMSYGKPCISFKDIDAFDDIYSPCAMIGISKRNNEDVAIAIENLIVGKWDKTTIVNYSQKFSNSSMTKSYLNVYMNIL